MKVFLLGLFFVTVINCSAQIKSLAGFKHTISYLHNNFKLDKFNSTCTTCDDCRKAFLDDSLIRADTTSYKWYGGSRTAVSCGALLKLKNLLKLDSVLQVKVADIENKYKSDYDSIYKEFIYSNKNWYLHLDNTTQYYGSLCEYAQAGCMIEQINIATIMVNSRIDELTKIDILLSN